jgi:hypothetical protein
MQHDGTTEKHKHIQEISFLNSDQELAITVSEVESLCVTLTN